MGAGGETSSLSGGQGSINASSNVAANFSSSLLDDFSALDMLFLDLEVCVVNLINLLSSFKRGVRYLERSVFFLADINIEARVLD